jgi:hypothetical protein
MWKVPEAEQASEMVTEETVSPPSAPYFSTYSHQFCEGADGLLRQSGKFPLVKGEIGRSIA